MRAVPGERTDQRQRDGRTETEAASGQSPPHSRPLTLEMGRSERWLREERPELQILVQGWKKLRCSAP